MKVINKVLCILMIALASCNSGQNTSTTNATGQQDTGIKQVTVKTDTSLRANDTGIHAKLNLVKIDNLDCPICRKPMSGGFVDTMTFACKLYGFDSKQCREDFARNPEIYKLK